MAIANAYGNKFVIPFNFEMLDSAMPYYQSGLRNRLCMKLHSVITIESLPDNKYMIVDVSLEYKIVS